MSIIKFVKRYLSNLSEARRVDRLIEKIRELRLTYLTPKALLLLVESIKQIENNNVEGDIIETGSALGGSSILIAKTKDENRLFKFTTLLK